MIPACSLAAMAAMLLAAAPAAPEDRDEAAPILTLDEAIDSARRNNHLLLSAAREAEKADERAAALRTHRLPALALYASAGRLWHSVDLTIPAGSLGNVPQLGPFPIENVKLNVPTDYYAAGAAVVNQPLTQQYRIGLGLDAAKLDRQVAEEDLRRERQRIAAEVKTTYYQISATEAGVLALRDLVRALKEVDALTTRYLSEELALRSDALEVRARLAREYQRLSAAQNGLSTQHEHLNQLMGRELTTPFRVATPTDLAPAASSLSLPEARERALATRPEIRKASLQIAQADTARKLVLAEWIPDITLSATYSRLVNIKTLPKQVGTVDLIFKWEPFDWERRSHEADERALMMQQAREGRQEAEQQIAVEVGMRWRALKDAAALLEATRLDAEACTASLEIVKNRYREDAKMLRDVLEAEARLSGARHDFTDALAGYWSAAAELERTIGNEN